MVANEHEPPIREFPDRSAHWLLESTGNVRDLLYLLAQQVADLLDFSRATPVKCSFVPADFHRKEADLLYRVPFKKSTDEAWIFILVEHQSKPDKEIGYRMLTYMNQAWEMHRRAEEQPASSSARWLPPVIPILFYTGKRRWDKPPTVASLMNIPTELVRFVPHFDILMLNLHETPDEALQGSIFAYTLQVMKAEKAPREAFQSLLARIVVTLEDYAAQHPSEWAQVMQYFLSLTFLRRPVDEHEILSATIIQASQTHNEEVEEMVRTYGQVLIRQGRQEGLLEGRQEGRQEAFGEVLLAQLETRFGPLPAEIIDQVKTFPISRLEKLARQVLTARNLEELHLAS